MGLTGRMSVDVATVTCLFRPANGTEALQSRVVLVVY
jgi:hypothetical protein